MHNVLPGLFSLHSDGFSETLGGKGIPADRTP